MMFESTGSPSEAGDSSCDAKFIAVKHIIILRETVCDSVRGCASSSPNGCAWQLQLSAQGDAAHCPGGASKASQSRQVARCYGLIWSREDLLEPLRKRLVSAVPELTCPIEQPRATSSFGRLEEAI